MRSLTLIVVALLTGCASTGPTFTNATGPGSCLLIGKNGMMIFSSDDTRVTFVEIDGNYVAPSLWTGAIKEVSVLPGKRTVVVKFEGKGYVFGQRTVQLECERGHSYRFAARKIGLEFEFSIYDEFGGEKNERLVESSRFLGQQGSGAAMVPIFIPVK